MEKQTVDKDFRVISLIMKLSLTFVILYLIPLGVTYIAQYKELKKILPLKQRVVLDNLQRSILISELVGYANNLKREKKDVPDKKDIMDDQVKLLTKSNNYAISLDLKVMNASNILVYKDAEDDLTIRYSSILSDLEMEFGLKTDTRFVVDLVVVEANISDGVQDFNNEVQKYNKWVSVWNGLVPWSRTEPFPELQVNHKRWKTDKSFKTYWPS